MPRTYRVVDLFAGPGGLSEGFSAFRVGGDHMPFSVALSVEKERSAHKTLLLRAFLHQFGDEYPPEYYEYLRVGGNQPDWASLYPTEWDTASEQTLRSELGSSDGDREVSDRIAAIKALDVPIVVLGGPPCQAYSLAGRARNKGTASYVASEDRRHFLYEQYIHILDSLSPHAFVMENVKGILSSSVGGRRIFQHILDDLRTAGDRRFGGYRLLALRPSLEGLPRLVQTAKSSDFVVRAEAFGVPQNRHRVIIVGLRADVPDRAFQMTAPGTTDKPFVTVRDVLSGLPPLRSGLSDRDSATLWVEAVTQQMERVRSTLTSSGAQEAEKERLVSNVEEAARKFRGQLEAPPRKSNKPSLPPAALNAWLSDPLLTVTLNHAGRSHMVDDLGRYFFSSAFSQTFGRAPKASEFPSGLAPAHLNWRSGKFSDRFRAQVWDQPASTITSHISKDGHYYIHPDPLQCRSLTVREAARLQTFPDNYLFLGNQTEQYVQVGNAVPPYLAYQIAGALYDALEQPALTR